MPPLSILLMVLMLSRAPAPEVPAAAQVPGDARLEDLLERLARVSELYRDAALRFSCEETITDSGLGGGTSRFDYIYVFDPRDGFKDYRTRKVRGRLRRVTLEKSRVPRFLSQAYSWAFVFAAARQRLHRYEILGEDTVLGRTALRLRFEPIPPYWEELNSWFGTAWIDRETSQLLRVEAMRPDQRAEQGRLEADLAGGLVWSGLRRYLIERVSTDFTVEKNGMRFPAKVVIEMTRHVVRSRDTGRTSKVSPVYRVEQTYDHYQFFSVRTQEEIRDMISGAPR